MRPRLALASSLSVLMLCLSTACSSSSPTPGETSSSTAYPGIVTTHHTATVDGKTLHYVARAGFIPIRDNEAGDVHGNMYFVAYSLEHESDPPKRPLTFLWNGGPGSSSSLVHLLGFGPKRVAPDSTGAPTLSPAGTMLVDNPSTWLGHTDLVFVDPIGTGYSRPTRAEYAKEFYQSPGDAESVAELIRVYRTRYDAFDQPLFIMGESYGVTRAALVAHALERRGTSLAGVILLGLALPIGHVPEPMRTALAVPTFTAAAYANGKLPADLGTSLPNALHAAEQWAEGDYARALRRRGRLSAAERNEVAQALARFTGLPADQIDRTTLRVTRAQVADSLLASEGRVVGHYDSRKTAPRDTTRKMYDPTRDPSLENLLDHTSVVRYMRDELGFESDLLYQGPFGGGYPPPTSFRGDWMSMRWNWSVPVDDSALATAMKADPGLRVLIACGYFDMVCHFDENVYAVRHLPAELAGRVTAHSYAGGHAVYVDDRARVDFTRDVGAFIDQQVDTTGGTP